MGFMHRFDCDSCGHQLELDGLGGERGFNVKVESCLCVRCDDVVDVVREYYSDYPVSVNDSKINYCPLCSNPDVVPWREPYKCPKCDGPMRGGECAIGLWD